VKPGWQKKTLDEVCDFRGGGTPSKAVQRYWQGDIPWVSPKDMKFEVVSDSIDHISKEAIERSATSMIPRDSVLVVVRSGILARTVPIAITGRDLTINQDLKALCPNSAIHPRFLYYLLESKMEVLLSMVSRGATVHRLTTDLIRSVNFVLPPLAEQKRIVGILDEVFESIVTAKANAEKNLQNARALFEDHLQSVFTQRGDGWEDKQIGEISGHSLGKMLDKAKNKGDLQPYLRNINVRWFTFDLSDLLKMRFLPEETTRYTALKGDVLICEGGYPGRAAIWDEDNPIYFQKALHRVRFQVPEHNKWFVYYLYAQDKSGALRRHFSGTGIQHFTGEVLNRYEVPIPPLPELRRQVAIIEELSAETASLESVYQRKIAVLEELKKSLLHQAFTGAL
jgi:type I restriction enzyme, S subunit